MKLNGETKVMVPWFDPDTGMKNWQMMTFRGTIDKRALLKRVAQYIHQTFNKKVSHTWIKKNCPMTNSEEYAEMISNPSAYSNLVDELARRFECDEDEDEGYSDSQTEDAGEAKLSVQDLSDKSEKSSPS